jgi:hypothetical protein
MVFFELRWNYSPLKEKAVLLPDGLFIFSVATLRFAPHRYSAFVLVELFLLLMQTARRASRPRGMSRWTEFVATLRFAPHRYGFLLEPREFLLLMQAARR